MLSLTRGRLGRKLSTLVKICLGYGQCLVVFKRYSQVVWPPTFSAWVSAFENFPPFRLFDEIFDSILPLDCILARTSGPGNHSLAKLVAYLVAPLAAVVALVLVSSLVAACKPPARRGGARLTALRVFSPALWNLVTWLMLFCYPAVSRRSLLSWSVGEGDLSSL